MEHICRHTDCESFRRLVKVIVLFLFNNDNTSKH